MDSIDHRSILPLYFQLAQILREQIYNDQLHIGDQMPSERELMQRHNISRNTVRQALDTLANEGLIVRRHGHGTYISQQIKNFHYMLDTFIENRDILRLAGHTPVVKQLSMDKVIPPKPVISALQLADGEQTMRFTLVFHADDEPAMYTQDFLPIKIAGEYDLPGGREGYLEYLDRSSGMRVEYVLVDIEPVEATSEIARIFRCKRGSPILLFKELFLDRTQNIPIAFSLNYFNRETLNFRLLARRG